MTGWVIYWVKPGPMLKGIPARDPYRYYPILPITRTTPYSGYHPARAPLYIAAGYRCRVLPHPVTARGAGCRESH